MYATENRFYFHSVTKESISHIYISIIKCSIEKIQNAISKSSCKIFFMKMTIADNRETTVGRSN
jgi:hypothetical protein